MQMVVFEDLPLQDTIWSIASHTDGKVYVALCGEGEGGLSVHIARYDPLTGAVEYLVDVAPALGESPGNGHATHSKIHYSMVSGDDDLLYCATHCTGPPAGDSVWRPWNAWDDPVKKFSGFHVFSFDPAARRIVSLGQPFPNEGCRALALDTRRRTLYGITYPRSHFFAFGIDDRHCVDLGRIGEFNPQAVFLDRSGNAYTTDDDGFILRCDADRGELTRLNARLPFTPWRNGFHNTLYDVVASPDGDSVYGCNWGFERRIFRFDFVDERIMDLGPAFGEECENWRHGDFAFHVGGMVFGADGMLYYAAYAWWENEPGMWLVRMNVETQAKEPLGPIRCDGFLSSYISRAARDALGNLYLAVCTVRPARMFIFRPDLADVTISGTKGYIRRWG